MRTRTSIFRKSTQLRVLATVASRPAPRSPLHELAHVEEGLDERDHGDEFPEPFLELTATAADWQGELEAAFGEDIDFDHVYRFIVESVHEERIEADCDDVDERKRWLRDRLCPNDADCY